MNSKTFEKLEFNKICKILSDFTITYIGKDISENINILKTKKEISKSLKQTTEAVQLLYKLGILPLSEIENVTIHIKHLENSDSLAAKQLLDLCNIFKISQNLKEYFNDEAIDKNEFPYLQNMFENLYSNPGIVKSISSAIIDENSIDDSASYELKNIRNNIRKKESEIQSKLNSLLHSKYIQEPIITIRNNRYVIPIKSEFRGQIKGFIHDVSTTGSTLFIEPISIFDINSEISQLKNEENIEIEKILMKLSSLFFDKTEEIKNTINLIGLIDFIFAKAKFSKEYNCSEPIINDEKFINLINCYHPLIPYNVAIKNSINLGKNFTSLIITGPNTGGKTVILKTVGLISLMGMCGLHIPAKEGSSIFIFDKIFADIGDEQSISDSLSTFSAHITNIAHILENATQNSLVLVDELGSGTDPIEGSSLAISILEQLKNNNILTIATTHYHEIKNYALITDGFENASVEFDLENLSPTYKLLIGVPGRSNAFIISKKLGISDKIINRAKDFINEDTTSIEELLNKIYKDTLYIEQEKSKIDQTLQEIDTLKTTYQKNSDDIKKKELEIIENAKIQAREILLSAKEDANEIIRELESKPDSKKSNSLRNKLNNKIDNLSLNKKTENLNKLNKSQIKIGLEVEIPSINQTGTIISNITKDDKVMVQIGIMKMSFQVSDLCLAKSSNKNKQVPQTSNRSFKISSISPEINVIGQNVEEACFIVDKYLDNCVLNGLKSIHIVHGKGTGTLKKGIHKFLKNHPHVESYRLGTFGEGEDGVTVVELK